LFFNAPVWSQEYGDSVVISVPDVEEDTEQSSVFLDLNENDKAPVAKRTVDAKQLDSLHKDEDFWYVDKAHRKKQKPKKEQSSSAKTNWLQPLIWILMIGGFIAVLFWFLWSSDVRLFRKPPQKTSREEVVEEDIFEIDYDKAIKDAIASGNFRVAVRLGYLQLLKELSERNIIRYSQQLTNSDYVMQLYGTNYYPDFFRITRHFEYAWYGGFNVSSAAYEKISSDLGHFKSKLA
jgi:hypothetical protein